MFNFMDYSGAFFSQICHAESRPSYSYVIDCEVVNGGIPYGDNFYVANRYCITRVSNSSCRLRICSRIIYRKSVWGVVKSEYIFHPLSPRDALKHHLHP